MSYAAVLSIDGEQFSKVVATAQGLWAAFVTASIVHRLIHLLPFDDFATKDFVT
jgi:hypothetical protein